MLDFLYLDAELDEILSLADRIAVIFHGEIIATIKTEDATRTGLGLLMAGSKNGEQEEAEPTSAEA